MEWVSLAATVILVGVTAWYAYLTKRLAASSEASAQAARQAAEATLLAARIAQAEAPVDFELQAQYNPAEPDTIYGVRLTGAASAVFVHSVTITEYSLRGRNGRVAMTVSTEIKLEGPDYITLPARLHRDEWLPFGTPDDEQIKGGDAIEAQVSYSFDGNEPTSVRLVKWAAPQIF